MALLCIIVAVSDIRRRLMMSEVKRVQIFGERSSGTNYLERLIEANLLDAVLTREYGFKHCFQRKGLRKPIDEECNFVIIYRNPYNWLRSLHRVPHHAPEMLGKTFSDFIRHQPWRTYLGEEWFSRNPYERNSIIKPANLREEYRNVIDLRTSKIRLFESFKNASSRIEYLRYEDLRDNPEVCLNRLAESFGLEACTNLRNISSYKKTGKKYRPTRYIRIRKQDLDFINEHLDWELENQIGYSRTDYEACSKDHIISSFQLFTRKTALTAFGLYYFLRRLFIRR